MKNYTNRFLLFSIFLGVVVWIVGFCLDYFMFSKAQKGMSLTEILSHEWYLVLFFIIFVLYCSRQFAKIKTNEDVYLVKEEILHTAQKMAHIGSWHLDIENNKLDWSDEVYRIFGLQPQEFGATYEAFLEKVHPDDKDMVDEVYREAIKNNTPYEIIHRVVRPNGEVRIVHEKSENIYDESGGTHSFGMVHDITEAKNNEVEKEKLIAELQKSISEIKSLRGIIPICSFCKKIRDDKGYWSQVETYMKQYSQELDFSHCVCPECMQKYYPELKG